MSIQVSNICKSYGEKRVLDDVCLDISENQIIGLLGLNGAGKSTFMKVLTGFIRPDSGSINVFGYYVDSVKSDYKHLIGYLPEHNPLYLDMCVAEYLRFLAKFYGLSKSKITRAIELTSLEEKLSKSIKTLSKGYRQRVGLAATIIHEPKLLVLDEPTSGLDFDQLVTIRELIKSFGKSSTIVMSSHIIEEIKHVCERVMVLKEGKIAIDTTPENLDIENLIEKQPLNL